MGWSLVDKKEDEELVTVSEARSRWYELARRAETEHLKAFIVRHRDPVAVLVPADTYEALIARLGDLEDIISVYESRLGELQGEELVEWERVKASLGLRQAVSSDSFYGFSPLPHRGKAVSNALIDRLREEEA